MNLKPLISVIIPVYNSEKYLSEAIESVLSQTDCNLDVIVVDDGSTDNTAKVVDSFGSQVRYNYRMNGGPAAARNHGVALARGDFFAFLDADDLWTADKITRQWMAFEADPELEMAFGHVRQFYSPDLSEEEKVKINIPVEIIPGHLPSTMLIKKKSFFRVGIFREELKIGDFIDWYARAVDLNLKSIMLRDVVLVRRIHSTNMGITHRNQRSGYVHALKAALDRRRAKG